MSIIPLPVFEADADPRHRDAMTDEEVYARLEPPKTVVVKFGCMKLVGEFKYDGNATPGCGSKLVARTHRGTELVEMLTTTCENAGCAKSITRQEMMEFIENSGGRDFPFRSEGRILRIATVGDLNAQSALELKKADFTKTCKAAIKELDLPMKLVEVEPILGEELLTFYFMAEQRVDFRELVRELAAAFKTRIEMRQVGARDEARLVADYERCGQHCCCKNFLKVLKPVSMRSAKLQKATLDPLKISGRCGRLMCCLRYEDQAYTQLKANLPYRNAKVGTVEGPGTVVETKVLVQLVLVRLEHDNREIAVPVEELMDPAECPAPGAGAPPGPVEESDSGRDRPAEKAAERSGDQQRGRSRHRRRSRTKGDKQATSRRGSKGGDKPDTSPSPSSEAAGASKPKRRRRRRGGQRPPKPPEKT